MSRILVANTSFPEMDRMAAAFAGAGLLSKYVRPYSNAGTVGPVARVLPQGVRSELARRMLPEPLKQDDVRQAGVLLDFALATSRRLGFPPTVVRQLTDARTEWLSRSAVRALRGEDLVVASWGCAERLFRAQKRRGGLCVLNYPLAHHRFTRLYLKEEAIRRPEFAATLNSHDYPAWLENRFENEIELADHILVGSTFVRDTFVAAGVCASKIVVVPYGTDIEVFEPSVVEPPASSGLRLLFVGQIGQRKGVSYLLEAAQELVARGHSLTLVGSYQGDEYVFRGYRHLFTHVPHVPRSELPSIYRQADAFVFPTLVEGMGIVVVEALASGLPVITTANGPGDIVRDGIEGYVVPPRDSVALVNAVQALSDDRNLRTEMARNARLRAGEFTWANYQERVVQLVSAWLPQAQARMKSRQ